MRLRWLLAYSLSPIVGVVLLKLAVPVTPIYVLAVMWAAYLPFTTFVWWRLERLLAETEAK